MSAIMIIITITKGLSQISSQQGFHPHEDGNSGREVSSWQSQLACWETEKPRVPHASIFSGDSESHAFNVKKT